MADINKQLSHELADQMLQNVFEVCEVSPNSVPLEDLESYSNYRKDKFIVRKVLLIIIMILFLLIPFLFVAPEITSIRQATSDTPKFTMSVSSLLPVTSVTAQMDGKNVPVYETSSKVYSIEPDANGEMLITVKAVNGQYAQKKVKVIDLDKTAPKLSRSVVDGGMVYLYLEEDLSGINYAGIYGVLNDGTKVQPASYSESDKCVVFDTSYKTVNVFIPDYAGNVLQLLLTT